jgi:hypothetical protein
MRLPQTHVSRPCSEPQIIRRRILSLLLICMIAPSLDVRPQPTASTEPVFGIGDNEFLIGGWNLPRPNTAALDTPATRIVGIPQVIRWARRMGVSVFRLPTWAGWTLPQDHEYFTTMLERADTTSDIRFFVASIPNADEPTFGIEAKFYLVPDSVPFKSWQCKFLYLDAGYPDTNGLVRDDWGGPSVEQIYQRDIVSANHTIADSIVLDWRPERTSWWSQTYSSGSGWCRVPIDAQQRLRDRTNSFWSPVIKGAGTWDSTNFVVVTGHLDGLEDQANADSTVLWIDIFYDIGRDEIYYDPIANGGQQFAATDNLSRYCTTLAVSQSDLAPRDQSESWDKYQQVALPFDATQCNDSTAGPLDPRNHSRRLNLRVRFAGNATVALRSIALRDHMANDVLSDEPAGVAARTAMRIDLLNLVTSGTPNTLHPSIIGFATDGEQGPAQAASVSHVNKWLQDGFFDIPDPHNGRNDTVSVWLEGAVPDAAHHQLSQRDSLGRMTMVTPEFPATQDSRAIWNAKMLHGNQSPYGGRKGAIVEHNGGRFGLPELPLRRDSIEYFERHEQLRHLRQYVPNAPASFLFQSSLTDPARLARDTRKRLVVIPFVSSNVWINETTDLYIVDSGTVGIDRIMEPAELRAAASVSLAMGARGIFWQVLTHGTDVLDAHIVAPGDTIWHGRMLDWPIQGLFIDDTLDRMDPLVFSSPPDPNGNLGAFLNTPRVFLSDFWTGWGVRSRAVRQYNTWLSQIGPELMKLTWHDAFSAHAQRPIHYYRFVQEGCQSNINTITTREDSIPARPIPTGESVSRVTARDPVTGLVDHDSATYVEVGFFDMKYGRRLVDTTWIADEMLDTHSVFVVNRRVFEPTDDLASGARRDSMVALAGTRTIGLKLNLMKFGEFTFCRVREIAPDLAPLPGSTVPRSQLDTIVPADSVIFLTLGPGRASLLRITYVQWDSTIFEGRLETSNQRKIVWDPDQARFHATYMIPNDTARFTKIGYRRSKKVTDSTGSILWEGVESLVSETGNVNDSIVFNRHPSLTIRRSAFGSPAPGTAITVVWTGHRVPVNYAARQVLLRTLWSPDSCEPLLMDPIVDVVDSAYYGHPDNRWGTPVVARLDGADVVAWSDSLVGIIASARVLKNQLLNVDWWKAPATYTDTAIVSGNLLGWEEDDSHGRYPSVPTFAHIVSRDSNISVVWEQPIGGMLAGFRRSDIFYSRLKHTKSGVNDTLVVVDSSFAVVNHDPGVNRNPSISQHQDDWREVQDVVTWESIVSPVNGFPANNINVRSIFTETRTFDADDQPDVINPKPNLWGWGVSMWRRNGLDWLYPNIASIGFRDSNVVREGLSSVAFRWRLKSTTIEQVKELRYQWADMGFKTPRQYTFSGRYPANSETPTEQRTRHALLYENAEDTTVPRLRTSREFFFARGRPVGYIADGRVFVMRTTDSTGYGFSYLMADAWSSSATVSEPIPMSERDTLLRLTNELETAVGLLSTVNFTASDSTLIGITLNARFNGDSTGSIASHATYVVELMSYDTRERVQLLDSFDISENNREHVVNIVDTLDLLSGTYYIRTLIDTFGVSVPEKVNDSRYPVGEFQTEILDTLPMFKLRRLPVTGRSGLRVTAQPNPTAQLSEVRFTVSEAGRVQVIVSDHDGRSATTLMDTWLEAGRYALEVDLSGQPTGRYIVQVHCGVETGIAKIVLSP